MNRNTIIGLIVIFAIFIGWSVLMRPSKEELEAQKRHQDSLIMVQRKIDSLNIVKRIKQQEQIQEEQQVLKDTVTVDIPITEESQIDRSKYGVFANSSIGENKFYTLENDLIKMVISDKGGRVYSVELKDYQTYDSLPLILFDSDTSVFGLLFYANNKIIFSNDFYFHPYINGEPYSGPDSLIATDGDSLRFSMRLFTDASDPAFNPGQYIEFTYTIRSSDYMVGFNINIVGLKDIISTRGNLIDLSWNTSIRKQEKSVDRYNAPTIYYQFYNGDVDYLSETKDDEESFTDKLKWVSFKQRFFSSTIIAKDYFVNPVLEVFTDPNPHSERYLKSMKATLGIPYDGFGDRDYDFSFYFGPNQYNTMRAYHLDLERQIPLGWSFFLMQWINRFAVIPVFTYLGTFGWNYGIIILVLTILLKILLFPIAYKTYKSSAKMRVLKPEVDELGKKFPKKEDAMKKQKAVMALYKKAGVNPMAGCIPMLLQFPILIAMFRFFPSCIELRQQPFLWATDLSSYDSILNLPFNIPFYGSHVSLFTLLMTVSTIIYTRINNQMMGASSQQMPGMKMMMYLMPVMFLGLFNNYASALSYYYLLANLITFAQMFLIRQTIDEKKIYQKIQEHKIKPKKKSGFQKRLAEAAKRKGYSSSYGKK